MNKNLHDIDKIFKDGLEDHLEPAPPGVWDAVNNDLDKKQAFHFKEKYYRLKRMALALLFIVFAGITALIYFGPANKSKNIMVAKDQRAAAVPGSSADVSSDKKTNDVSETASDTNAALKDPETAKGTTSTSNDAVKAIEATAKAADKISNDAKTQGIENKTAFENKTNKAAGMPVGNNKREMDESSLIHKNNNLSATNTNIEPPATGNLVNTSIANKKGRTQQFQGFDNKQLLSANHRKQGHAAIALNNNFSSVTNDGNSNGRSETTEKDQLTSIDAIDANKTNNVPALSAYLYQSPLLFPTLEQPAPGPFKAIDQPPFLNSIQQNDSLKKAYAIAKIKAASKHTISIMPFVAPNHSFTRLEDNSPFAGPGRNKNAAEREERQSTSFSAGVLVNYGLTKAVIVQSGIVFSSAKTNISPKTIYAKRDNTGHASYEFNCASGYSYINPKSGTPPAIGDSIKAMGASSTISYIGVPVSLIYVWQKGRLLLKPGIGVSVNFLTNGKSATSFYNAGANQKEKAPIAGLKNSYVDASIGFGTEFMLNRKISVGVRPLLRMALTSINKDTPVKAYQNFLSLETGIKINL